MTAHTEQTRADWSWLMGTTWYVLTEDLPALQYDPSKNTLTWLVDQTVWQITGYRNGYFWGIAAVLTHTAGAEAPQQGPRARPVDFAMLGSITPEGHVHLTFVPSKAWSSRSAVIGVGRAVAHEGGFQLEMQMSSGSGDRTAHWARMTRTQPGDASWARLPGVGLSVPEMLEGAEPPALTPVASGDTA